MSRGPQLKPREYEKLAALLTRWTGINLHAKEHMMLGRLQPRLRALQIATFGDYLQHLEQTGRGGPEAQQFINALTTNKTSFFREAHHFDFLVNKLFADVRARSVDTGQRRLRLWSAGCSRGAEPYTLAMLAAEHLPATQGWDIKILATDLDTDVLAFAQSAVYEASEIAEVPVALRKRFFVRQHDDTFQVHADARKLVTFAQANLIVEPFPVRGRFDAILCRNVMIYFDRPTQQRLVNSFVRRLGPGGYLIIGHSESMVAQHLPRVHDTLGVYQPVHAPTTHAARAVPTVALPKPPALPRAAQDVVRAPQALALRPVVARPTTSVVRAKPPVAGLAVKRIVLGEWFTTREPMLVSTLLGSCVSACLYDPIARVSGMNHFMLPKVLDDERGSARFGIHAMELLINELMQLGAQRARLRGMAFGGASVNRALGSTVAQQNADFVRQFLTREQIPLVCERLGGEKPAKCICARTPAKRSCAMSNQVG
jgi:chemotaxis protein methyltransferase CheR